MGGGDKTDDSTKKKGNKDKNATREESSTNLLQHPALESLLRSSLVQEKLGSLDDALAEKGGDNTDDSTKKKGKKDKNATRADTSTNLLQEHIGSLEAALASKGEKTDDSTKKKGKKDKNATREDSSTDLLQYPAIHSLLQENVGSLDAALAEKGGDNTDGSTKKKGNKKNSTREETSTNLLQEHLGSLDAALAEKGSDNTDGSTKKKGNKKNSTREETSTNLL